MKVIGNATVKVDMDVRGAAASVERQVKDSLRNSTSGDELEGGLRKALRSVNLGDADFSKITSKIGSALSGAVAFGALAAKFSLVAGAASAAVLGVLGLGNAIVSASAVALLFPAIGAAVAASLATMVVGMKGFGEALKNTGDPAKFDEALKNLAPSAQQTAIAIRNMGPAFHDLRLDVQQRLFAGVGEQLSQLGKVGIPVLRQGMTGLATAINSQVIVALAALRAPQNLADIGLTFRNITASANNFAPAIHGIITSLIQVVAVGSGELPALGTSLANAAGRLTEFVERSRETGQLQQSIRGAIETIKTLGGIVFNVGGIIRNVFLASGASGQDLLGTIRDITGGMRDWARSFEGQQVLISIFSGLKDAADGLGRGLHNAFAQLNTGDLDNVRSIFRSIGDTLASLGTVLGSVIHALGPGVAAVFAQLAPTIDKLAGPIGRVAQFFGDILTAVAPLLPQIGQLIGAFTDFLITALRPLLPALTRMAEAILPPLTDLFVKLGPPIARLIEAVLPPLVDLFEKIAPVLVKIVEDLLPPLIDLFVALAPVIEAAAKVIGFFVDAIGAVAGVVGGAIKGVGNLIKAVTDDGLKEFFQHRFDEQMKKFLEESFNSQDIGEFVANLGQNSGELWTEAFGSGVETGVRDLGEVFAKSGKSLKEKFADLGKPPGDFGAPFIAAGKYIVEGFAQNIAEAEPQVIGATALIGQGMLGEALGFQPPMFGAGFGDGGAFAAGLRAKEPDVFGAGALLGQTSLGAVIGFGDDMFGAGAFDGGDFAAGLASKWTDVFNSSHSLGDAALGAVDDFGSAFFGIGDELGNGLAAGIISNLGEVYSAARSLGQAAENAVREFGEIRSPSRLFDRLGKFFGAGLAQGLTASVPQVSDAATGLSSAVADALLPTADLGASLSASFADTGAAIGTNVVINQQNNMQPGADVPSFAGAVSRNLASALSGGGATVLRTQELGVQIGRSARVVPVGGL